MIVQKIEKCPVEIDIVGATLLTIEEAKQLPIELRKYKDWWWLRSPGDISCRVALVNFSGSVIDCGYFVRNERIDIRPALKISNLESYNFKIGDQFEFGGTLFKIISDNLAFCLSDIGQHCFRKDWEAENANDYEKSDVKKFVDEWFNVVKENKE